MKESIAKFSDDPTEESLQYLLFNLFDTWKGLQQPARRDDHIIGNFLKFSGVRKGNNFASIGDINHSLVKLLYVIRMVAFKELTIEGSAHTKEEIFRIVKLEYVFSFSFSFSFSFPLVF